MSTRAAAATTPTNRPQLEAIANDMAAALRSEGIRRVDSSARRRAEYSSDASNYRVPPSAVVFPESADEVPTIVRVAREFKVPITMRGGGTSVAGNAIGTGIIVDMSRHVHRILEVNAESRTVSVEPGATLGAVQRAVAEHGLRIGPDPSTWARCTIGGMIGNNACGPRALAFGRTADNVLDLDVVDGTGTQRTLSAGRGQVASLDDLVDANLGVIRTELDPGFSRRISGFSLEHLLPEAGRDVAKAFAGTEGTLGVITRSTMRLVDVPGAPTLVVLGYPDMATAADNVPAIIEHGPVAIEGLDARIVDAVRRLRPGPVPELPAGGGWLLIEVAGTDVAPASERAAQIAAASGTTAVRILPPGAESRALWRIREDGAGLAGRTGAGRQAWPGLEDAAVPPVSLGAYLREFHELTREYGIEGMPYGHFGDGCVHVRLDIPLEHDGSTLRRFMLDAGKLIASYGGSLSGEHGDGRARSELLPLMYSERMIALFGAVKHVFDPDDIMNPGVIVRPEPLDVALRRPGARTVLAAGGLAFRHDEGDITAAVHRCVGVGRCRVSREDTDASMCPSFMATRDEKDSTRGRARVLQEMLNGEIVRASWRSPEVHDALDLCLSCKACATDCPAGVDMAALKSETLHRSYRGRLRPISHYTLGWMPRWARLATSGIAPVVNTMLGWRSLERFVLWFGGMDPRRTIPRFAPRTFRRWWRKRSGSQRRATRKVVLWTDTFSDNFSPDVATAAVHVLESAGYEVVVPERSVCCGLTWISTGQLDGARRRLQDLVDTFIPYAREGTPILGLEPSCTATVRSDLLELLPDDSRARVVAESTYTLAELLTAEPPVGPGSNWQKPDLTGVELVVQPHCHHHAVIGYEKDEALLAGLGASITVLSGCCGLAGNFGMERGHYDVSVAVAENALLPALRENAGAKLLADGLSCRTQASQLGGVDGLHLAQLLEP